MNSINILFTVFIVVLILFVPISFLLIPWQTHLSMTKDRVGKKGYASYKKFKLQFEKAPVVWYSKRFKGSLFAHDMRTEKKSVLDPLYDQYQIHASIFQFEGNYMLFRDPITYFLVCRYVRKFQQRENEKNIIKW